MNSNPYEKSDEVVSGLQNEVEECNSKIEESVSTIATLQQDNERLENELNDVNSNYTTALENIETLTAENEALNTFKADVELKAKEAVIDKYTTLLDEEDINGFRDKLDEFTKEELDKELAYVLVQSKSTIFTTEDSDFVPKDEPTLTGIEAILERQKNKKK
jgi:SMC interacting uncharacterized protein involved in chromosome segregation